MNKQIDDYTQLPGFEHKTIPTFVKAIDEKQGIVEHIVSVFGIRDMQGDRVTPGAFTKTIAERAGKIRTLDQHMADSALRVVGRPIAMREIGAGELPAEVLAQYPDATGGLLATTQYAMKTDNGRNMFHLVDGGFLPETSIGYDPITSEFIEEEIDGDKVTTRLLKEIRLWEYSNVIWGANPATTTTGTKEAEAGNANTEALPGNMYDPEPNDLSLMDARYVGADGGQELIVGHDAIEKALADEEKTSKRPAECKAVNLQQQMNDVVRGFYGAYPDTSDYMYWVREVWDEYLIVTKEIVGGETNFRVPYTIFSANGSTSVAYAAPEQWTQVEHVWVPIEPTDEPVKTALVPDEQAATGQDEDAEPVDRPLTSTVTEADIDEMINKAQRELRQLEANSG